MMLGSTTCHRGEREGRRGRRAARPRDVEEVIAFAERRLGITADQREAWDRLAEALRDSADVMQTARTAVDEAGEQALARFTAVEVVADIARAALRRIRPALEALYVTLEAPQRAAFDELFTRASSRPFGA